FGPTWTTATSSSPMRCTAARISSGSGRYFGYLLADLRLVEQIHELRRQQTTGSAVLIGPNDDVAAVDLHGAHILGKLNSVARLVEIAVVLEVEEFRLVPLVEKLPQLLLAHLLSIVGTAGTLAFECLHRWPGAPGEVLVS